MRLGFRPLGWSPIKAGTNHRRIGDISAFLLCSPQHIVFKRIFIHMTKWYAGAGEAAAFASGVFPARNATRRARMESLAGNKTL
jgi:hypothetical protein